MPRNNTGALQFVSARTADGKFSHVIVLDPGLVVDTGLTELNIFDNEQGLRDFIATLIPPERGGALSQLNQEMSYRNG